MVHLDTRIIFYAEREGAVKKNLKEVNKIRKGSVV